MKYEEETFNIEKVNKVLEQIGLTPLDSRGFNNIESALSKDFKDITQQEITNIKLFKNDVGQAMNSLEEIISSIENNNTNVATYSSLSPEIGGEELALYNILDALPEVQNYKDLLETLTDLSGFCKAMEY
ncbi:MAG TPA: hypothetical protein LFW21_07175 [Rickettsia endosymbiont of Pyrocoelia pectoralis]|nr:hypothetical protein [Rickettsia endosymbiont of Pyrocoelia pectoralis]